MQILEGRATHTHGSDSVSTVPVSPEHFHTVTKDNCTWELSALRMIETINNLPNSDCCFFINYHYANDVTQEKRKVIPPPIQAQ